MRTISLRSSAQAFCTLVVLSALPAPAMAVGYWNVPSTYAQWWGYGCGAGYHVPLILGPITHGELCDHKEVRLPYAPAPPYARYASGTCCTPGWWHQQSQLEELVPIPQVQDYHAPAHPQPMPTPAVLHRPVER